MQPQMQREAQQPSSSAAHRLMMWILVALAATVVFGTLFFGVRSLG